MEKNICGFNITFLKQVNNLMEDSNIQELEMEEGDSLYLRISKKKPVQTARMEYSSRPTDETGFQEEAQAAKEAAGAVPVINAVSKYDDESKYYKIKSPVIGTFYESPTPQSPPYVKTGDKVSADTTVCIVEAMKIMNEIKADTQGKIIEVYKANGSPVLSGEPLYLIELM
jgi:acetyl-CoA carboxylase biotin carboxyl carrier protein